MDDGSPFGSGVGAWRRVIGTARDTVRQELIARQLAGHLPPRGSALDVGCGQGTQAISLARRGHEVLGVDLSPELLADARRSAAAETADVRARLCFEHGDLLRLGRSGYDVVCCHGVLMYIPALEGGVQALVGAAAPGGLVSVLTRNRASLAMRAGMSGDWRTALDSFDARRYTNRLGIDNVRADDPVEVRRALARAGARTLAWYGVRLFSDNWPDALADGDLADGDLEPLIDAEEQAGLRDPYRRVAAMTHTIARVGPVIPS